MSSKWTLRSAASRRSHSAWIGQYTCRNGRVRKPLRRARSAASRRSRSSAVHEFDLTCVMKVRTSRARSSCCMGLARPSLMGRSGFQTNLSPSCVSSSFKLGQAVTEHDVRPRGLHQRRPVPGVHAALPCHALGVALKLRGRLTVPAECPMLMPHVNAGVVKVRPVLQVRGVADVDVVGPFVDVVDPVEVQEVGDQPFAVALDNLAGECPVAGWRGGGAQACR